jgi:hypothetical protein
VTNDDDAVEPEQQVYSGVPLIILDTDIGSSTDDLFALEMLYRYQEQNRSRLLGVVVDRDGSIVITGTLTVTGSGTLRVLANEGGEGENGSDSFAVVRCCSAAARSEASTLVTPASESTRMTIPPATASGADWGRKI